MSERQLTTKDDPIIQMLMQYRKAITSLLPRHMSPERALRLAHTIITRNPKIKECTTISIVNANPVRS